MIVLTNGCGGLNPQWQPGTTVLIRDHINLSAQSPIEGPNFVDVTDLYTPRLREIAREVDPTLDEGVYVQFRGPQYETPAEVRMAKILGGDLVGMSTGLEAIAARQVGLEVLGISFDPPAENAKFVAAESFPFRLLTDDGTLAAAVGAAQESGARRARRISYLVGPDGKVKRAYDEVVPADHAKQVLADATATTK